MFIQGSDEINNLRRILPPSDEGETSSWVHTECGLREKKPRKTFGSIAEPPLAKVHIPLLSFRNILARVRLRGIGFFCTMASTKLPWVDRRTREVVLGHHLPDTLYNQGLFVFQIERGYP